MKGKYIMSLTTRPTNLTMILDNSNPVDFSTLSFSSAHPYESSLLNCTVIQPTQTTTCNLSDTKDSAPTEKTTLLTGSEISTYRKAKPQITPEQTLSFNNINLLYARMLLQDTTQKLNLKSNESLNYYPLHEILLKKNWTGFEKLDIVQLMLKYKTAEGQALDINAMDNKGRTVLLITLFDLNSANKDSIVYELLTHGADIGVLYESNSTVLHLAIEQYSKTHTQLTTISFKNEAQEYIMLTAQLEQTFDMIELLFKFYKLSDFEIVDSKNKTVLMCAQENKLDNIVNAIQTRQLELSAMAAMEAIKTTPSTQPESKLPLQHKPKFNFPALVPMSSTHNLEFLKACTAGNFGRVQALLDQKTEEENKAIDLNLGFFSPSKDMFSSLSKRILSTGFLYVLNRITVNEAHSNAQRKKNTGCLNIARHILTKYKQQLDLTLVNELGQTALNIVLENTKVEQTIKAEMVELILNTSSQSLITGKPNNINYINFQGFSYLFYGIQNFHVRKTIIEKLVTQNIDLTIQYKLPVIDGTILHQLIYWLKDMSNNTIHRSKAFTAFQKLLYPLTDSSALEISNQNNESVWNYACRHCTQCFDLMRFKFPNIILAPQNTLSDDVLLEVFGYVTADPEALPSSSNRKRSLDNASIFLFENPNSYLASYHSEEKKPKQDSNDVIDSQDDVVNVVMTSEQIKCLLTIPKLNPQDMNPLDPGYTLQPLSEDTEDKKPLFSFDSLLGCVYFTPNPEMDQ